MEPQSRLVALAPLSGEEHVVLSTEAGCQNDMFPEGHREDKQRERRTRSPWSLSFDSGQPD